MLNVVAGAFGLGAALLFQLIWHLAGMVGCSDNVCAELGQRWIDSFWLMELGGSAMAFLLGAAVTLLMRRWFLSS